MNALITKSLQKFTLYTLLGLLFSLPSMMTIGQTNCSNAISIYDGYQGNFSVNSIGGSPTFTDVATCGTNSDYLTSGAVRVFKYTTTENAQSATLVVDCSSNPTSNPGASDGSITLTVTGFTTQLVAQAGPSATIINSNGTYTLGNLSGGSYVVQVTSNGSVVATCTAVVEDGAVDACDNPMGLAGADQTICIGEIATIGCEPIEGYCYHWSPTTGFLDASMVVSAMPEVSPDVTTTYSLTITNDDGDIVEEGLETIVNIRELPVQIEEIQEICPGEIVIIQAIPEEGTNHTFLWGTGETTQSIEVSPEESTIYSVEVQDTDSGCIGTTTSQVTILQTPTISILSTHSSICELAMAGIVEKPDNQKNATGDCDNESVRLYAGTGITGYSYLWSNGETEPLIEVFEAGIYSVTVTKDGGCSSTASYELNSCVEVEITIETIQVGNNEQAILDAGEGGASYEWRNESNQVIGTNQTVNLDGPGEYSVTVVNNEGCIAKDNFLIEEYDYDPSEIFLVMSVLDDNANKQSLYVCSSMQLSDEDKENIGNVINQHLPSPSNGYQTNPIFWTCNANHTEEFPINKNANTSDPNNLRMFPLRITSYDDQLRVLNLYLVGNEWKPYDFKLDIGTQIANTGSSFFTVAYQDLPDNVSAELSIQDEDDGNPDTPITYSSISTMNITFESSVPQVIDHPYLLYANEEIVDGLLEEQEGTTIPFQLKKENPDGTIVNLDFNSTDPFEIVSIFWHGNNEVGSSYVNQSHFQWKIPEYTMPDEQVQVKATIRFKNNAGDEVVATLTADIKILEKPFVPGHTITDLPEGVNTSYNNCNSNPRTHVEAALAHIKNFYESNPDIPNMYAELFDNNQIKIILTTSNHKKFNANNNGDAFGAADASLFGSNRIKVEPNLVEKWDDGSAFSHCPKEVPVLLLITQDEYEQIRMAINNTEQNDDPLVVQKIQSVYGDIGSKLVDFCNNGNFDNIVANIKQLDTWRDGKLLAYEGTETETLNNIFTNNTGEIYLAVDNLQDIRKNLKVNVPFNVNTMGNDPRDLWIGHFNTSCMDKKNVRDQIYRNYIAHEMAHIFYTHQDESRFNAFMWSEMEKIFSYNDTCYPGKQGVPMIGNDSYCSIDRGHFYKNPNGLSVCKEVLDVLEYELPVKVDLPE